MCRMSKTIRWNLIKSVRLLKINWTYNTAVRVTIKIIKISP